MDEMFLEQNIPRDNMFLGQNVPRDKKLVRAKFSCKKKCPRTNVPQDKIFLRTKNSWGQHVPRTKFPKDNISTVLNVPMDKMFPGQNVHRDGQHIPGTKSSRAKKFHMDQMFPRI